MHIALDGKQKSACHRLQREEQVIFLKSLSITDTILITIINSYIILLHMSHRNNNSNNNSNIVLCCSSNSLRAHTPPILSICYCLPLDNNDKINNNNYKN